MAYETVHTFAGNPFDRAEALRRDEEQIQALAEHPEARFLPFQKLKVAVSSEQQLAWQSQAWATGDRRGQIVFLGVAENVPHFAVDVLDETPGHEYSDCRLLAAHLSTPETGILAQARAQLDWHQRNPFCAQCGAPSIAQRGGQIRRCTGCDKHIFPRTDPVAIMLITDGAGHCLLGQSQGRMAQTNFFSALAGFIDQGESIEDAVRREVWEEAGVRVGEVTYHSSQPWPFPSQLMIGCLGQAETTEINIDPTEMSAVHWFSRDAVSRALADDNPDLRVPGAMAIAHHLIKAWVDTA